MNIVNKIKKHHSDIRKEGFKEFLRKLKTLNFIIINFFLMILFALPLLIFLVIVSPLFYVRFGIIRSSRIGHFLANTEIYLRSKALNLIDKKNIYDFISFDDVGISNSFLEKNYRKKIKIFPTIFIKPICDLLSIFSKKYEIFKKFEVSILNSRGDRDTEGLIYKAETSIEFDKKDLLLIEKQLSNFNLDLNSKFICLTVRDDAYLRKTYPKGDWNYHNHRNWKIKTFLKASEELTKRGYKVIRMGKFVNEELISDNPMIIDYANSDFKSDILDIYLHTKCFFTATTGTGIDLASYVTKRPTACIHVPIAGCYTFRDQFLATKHHKFQGTKNKLSLSEMFETGFAVDPNTNNFKDKVYLEELNENEVCDFLIEVLDILENKFLWSSEDRQLQAEFWKNYKRLINKNNFGHLHKNYEAIFSPSFLRNNLQLLK